MRQLVRLEVQRHRLDQLRQPQHLADQRQLRLVDEQRDVAVRVVSEALGRLR